MNIVESYNRVADIYDSSYSDNRSRKENNYIKKLIDHCSKGSVLDIGSGTGLYLDLIPTKDYVGVDPAFEMIKISHRKHLNNIFFQGTIKEVFGRFDSVISLFGSVSYLDKEELHKLKEICNNSGFYFLMHYKPRYKSRVLINNGFSGMTNLSYSQIMSKFYNYKGVNFYSWDPYIIITNKRIGNIKEI